MGRPNEQLDSLEPRHSEPVDRGSLVANACVVLLLRPRTISTSQPADAPAAVSTVANLILKPGTTSADTHRIPDATRSAG